MTLKFHFLLLILLLFTFFAQAEEVSPSEARSCAHNFFNNEVLQNQTGTSLRSIVSEQTLKSGTLVNLYVFNFEDGGFVILSGDDAAFPVLAFDSKSSFSDFSETPNVANWIQQYSDAIEYIRVQNIKANQNIENAWNTISNPIGSSNLLSGLAVGPLTTSIWSQGCYFNDQCPSDPGGPCNHVVTGCVATAMAQVMQYNNFPPMGAGQHSYNSSYGLLSANFGNTNYDWNLMPDTLNSSSTAQQVFEVSQLISHCGIAVDMGYSPGGSGAYSADAKDALVHYFNYSKDIQLLNRANYTDSIWSTILRAEIDSARVMYYDGAGTGAHAFVCDGYQYDDFFHFNWGWGGAYNGYFYTASLNPAGYNFSVFQNVMVGIEPDSVAYCQGAKTLTLPTGSFSDGSSAQQYQSGSSCSWLIQPVAGIDINLEFFTFNLEQGDTVFVFDGSQATSPILGMYTGNTLPPILSSSSNTMLIEFSSDNILNSDGFSASYLSNFCGNHQLTAVTDTFGDGSGSYIYNPNSQCSWLIQPPGANSVTLEFTEMSIESGYDYVSIYDGPNQNATQLGSFSGSTNPGTFTSSGNSLFVTFSSDGGVEDRGWEALYIACFDAPAITASDTLFCRNDSVTLNASIDGIYSNWLYNGNPILFNDSVLITSNPGIYQTIFEINGCQSDTSDQIIITELTNPNPNLGADTAVYYLDNLLVSTPGSYSNYYWHDSSVDSVFWFVGTTLGINTLWLTVTDQNGCSGSDTLDVVVIALSRVDESYSSDFNVIPNPSNGLFRIEGFNPGLEYDLYITEISGKEITEIKVSSAANSTIDLRGLSKGIYLLQIKNEIEVVKVKLIYL